MARPAFPALAFAALLLGALQLLAIPAKANGVPQLVKLTYLDGVSNWGPASAEGVLEFSFAEAYARVDVKNLPPQQGFTMDAWLVAPDGSAFYVSPITSNADGIGRVDVKLEGLERYDYDLFVITGRTGAEPGTAPSAQRSIAGRFTVIKDANASQASGNDTFPTSLPDTGQLPAEGPGSLTRAGYALAAMALVAIGAVLFRKLHGRKSHD